jgi:hypothetical protein
MSNLNPFERIRSIDECNVVTLAVQVLIVIVVVDHCGLALRAAGLRLLGRRGWGGLALPSISDGVTHGRNIH